LSVSMCALRWTGGLSRVSPAFALCQLGSAPAPHDPNEDEAVLIMDGWDAEGVGQGGSSVQEVMTAWREATIPISDTGPILR